MLFGFFDWVQEHNSFFGSFEEASFIVKYIDIQL